jgi:hypothetical protein
MSETVDRTVEDHGPDGQVIATRTVRYEFTAGELHIGQVTLDAAGNEQVQPGGYQPWHCMPDGTRQPWADAEDAFAWADAHLGVSK